MEWNVGIFLGLTHVAWFLFRMSFLARNQPHNYNLRAIIPQSKLPFKLKEYEREQILYVLVI